jgi:hypothetical protein
MDFTDSLTIDGKWRKTADGYLVADVRAARTGVQSYTGREVDPENALGLRDMAVVSVYRPEETVFATDALKSFTSLPITNDHPNEAVNAENYRRYAVGDTGEDILRDGQFIRVPIMVKDAAAIRLIEGGKRQLSMGYSCTVVKQDGTTPDGLHYDAVQTSLRGNHLAIVSAARGGDQLTIGDSIVTLKPVTITLDGASHTVELSDAAAILVGQLQTKLTDALTRATTAETNVGTLTVQLSTKDGEIAGLTSKLTDAAITPAKLDAAVADRSKVIDAAKTIFPALVADGKTLAEIRKEAVTHKIADAATMADAAIDGAFAALSATIVDAGTTDTLANGLRDMKPSVQGEKLVSDARAEMIAGLKNPNAKAA